MSSFVFQPTKEEAIQTTQQTKKKQYHSAISIPSNLKKSLLQVSNSNLKSSITLEQRGITFGKPSKSSFKQNQFQDQQVNQLSRTSKIDCSDVQSQIVNNSLILQPSKYAQINPLNNIIKEQTKADLPKHQVSGIVNNQQQKSQIRQRQKQSIQILSNSSAIPEERQIFTFVILIIILFSILFFQHKIIFSKLGSIFAND